jgi:asparagine synthase (glutamine-hydrolysing)
MTGIAGFFKTGGGAQEDIVLAGMLDTFSEGLKQGELVVKRDIVPGIGGICKAKWSWATDNNTSTYPGDSIYPLYIQGDMYGSTVEELLQIYRSKGTSFLKGLPVDGAFAGVLLDKKGRKSVIFTDPFGLEPLYYYFHDGIFAFSSNIKGLLAVPGVNKSVDVATFASFWNFGYALLDYTPFKHIRLLPPSTVLVLDLNDWREESFFYDTLLNLFAQSEIQENEAGLDETAKAFMEAVQKRSDDASSIQLGLSLSGGLDSRTILGGLGEKSKGLKTYTLGLPGCADERLAAKMAKVYKCTHEFIPIEEAALKDFESLVRMMVTLSDGLYHPHESTERVALNYLATRPFDVMLRGHGGEIAKAALAYPVQATREMVGMTSEDVVRALFEKSSLAGNNINMASLLTSDVYKATDGMAKDMFQQAAEPAISAGISNVDLCIYLYIDQCIRRQIVASLSLFRSKVGIRLPYLDRDFLNLLLRLPVEKRWAGEFHHYFIHHFAPQLENIPDSNTGAPLNAGPLRLLITDKINAVLKRLGVTGFRHYTEFQKWQRKYFSNVTKEILFSEQSMDRGYYRAEGLREIFDLHVSGQRDHAHFLGTAVAIELWHRIFVD